MRFERISKCLRVRCQVREVERQICNPETISPLA